MFTIFPLHNFMFSGLFCTCFWFYHDNFCVYVYSYCFDNLWNYFIKFVTTIFVFVFPHHVLTNCEIIFSNLWWIFFLVCLYLFMMFWSFAKFCNQISHKCSCVNCVSFDIHVYSCCTSQFLSCVICSSCKTIWVLHCFNHLATLMRC